MVSKIGIKFWIFLFTIVLLSAGGCGVGGSAVKTELYFGLIKGDGGTVSKREWERFVDDVVTPRFEEGFTIVDAKAQWVGKEEELIKEKTKIIILLHRDNWGTEKDIEEIRDKYKELFEQEEVLRISSYPKGN